MAVCRKCVASSGARADTAPVTGSPQMLRPRALRPGDLVVIAALSGPVPSAYQSNVDQTVVMCEGVGSRVRGPPLLGAGRRRGGSTAPPAEIAAELNGLL